MSGCPTCGEMEIACLGSVNPDRAIGPGERLIYQCVVCAATWEAIAPEPVDEYAGDGVFAENH